MEVKYGRATKVKAESVGDEVCEERMWSNIKKEIKE